MLTTLYSVDLCPVNIRVVLGVFVYLFVCFCSFVCLGEGVAFSELYGVPRKERFLTRSLSTTKFPIHLQKGQNEYDVRLQLDFFTFRTS